MSGTAKLVTNLVGTKLGDRYVLEEKIGSGGFAVVYRSRDTRIHKQVAIKVLDRAKVQSLRDIARFRNEAAIAAAIDDEHIIKITDYGEEGTIFYYVMELLRGHTLRSILTMHDRLHWQRACDICEQACLALELAHEHTIIHRDVKPENIFIEFRRGAENVKLLDLGIAKVLHEWDGLIGNLSTTGDFIGSPSYMAPELARGTKYADFRVDLYAIGVVLYELVTGTVPFRGESAWETMLLHVEQPPPPVHKRAPDVECPSELEALIMRALSKDPGKRFQTASELGEAIRAVRTSHPAIPWTPLWTPPSPPEHSQPPLRNSGPTAHARTTPAEQADRGRENLPQKTVSPEPQQPAPTRVPPTEVGRTPASEFTRSSSPEPARPHPTRLERAPETVPVRAPETVPTRAEPVPAIAPTIGAMNYELQVPPLRWRSRIFLGYLTVGSLIATCATSTLAAVTLRPDVLEQFQQRPRRIHVLNPEPQDEDPPTPPVVAPSPAPQVVARATPESSSPFDKLLLAPPEAATEPTPNTPPPSPVQPPVPAESEPVKPEPVKTEPVKTEPVKTEPESAKKKPGKPAPTPDKTKPDPAGDLLEVQKRPSMAAIARGAAQLIKENCLITPFSPLKEAKYTLVFRVTAGTGAIESITAEGDLPPLRQPDCVRDFAKRNIKSFAGAGDLKSEYRHSYVVVR